MLVAVKDRFVMLGGQSGQEGLLRADYQKLFGEAPDGVYTLIGDLADGMEVEIDAGAGTATVVIQDPMTNDDERDAHVARVRAKVIDLGFSEAAVDQFIADNPLN